jgi:prephenate dehydrogenase
MVAGQKQRVSIIGVGLIGGSIGLAARRRGQTVAGYDHDRAALDDALAAGAIDLAAADIAAAVADADLIFVCVPVSHVAAVAEEALVHALPTAAISDVGSTKLAIATAISDSRFIGGHPLAGAEVAGVAQARADLFERAVWYLTPSEHAGDSQFESIQRFISEIGARPQVIAADEHDQTVAIVSHVPHVLANLLVQQVCELHGDTAVGVGPSFRDATRVAGSNTAIWTDIYVSNRQAIAHEINELTEGLAAAKTMIESGDRIGIAQWNDRSMACKRQLDKEESSHD